MSVRTPWYKLRLRAKAISLDFFLFLKMKNSAKIK